MTIYTVLSKVETIPQGKINFTYGGSGSGMAFTVPQGVVKIKVTFTVARTIDMHSYAYTTGNNIYDVSPGQTIYAGDSRWCTGAPGVTPIFIRPSFLEYGPDINNQ